MNLYVYLAHNYPNNAHLQQTNGVWERAVALEDQKNLKFMGASEAYDHRCAQAAQRLNNKSAVKEYLKRPKFWGWDAMILSKLTGDVSGSMFNTISCQ